MCRWMKRAGHSRRARKKADRRKRRGHSRTRMRSHTICCLAGRRCCPCLDLEETWTYLKTFGFDHNILKEARENIHAAKRNDFDPDDAHRCDFCARSLADVDYEVLADGRERCPECSRTAVHTVEEFRHIYDITIQNYEAFFGVRITAAIKLEMVDANTLHRKLGKSFVPRRRLQQQSARASRSVTAMAITRSMWKTVRRAMPSSPPSSMS